jgi:hypothetical protein
MGSIGGQSSGDFTLTQGALRILYTVIKGDTIPDLAADAFTQNNPSSVTAAAALSTTLPANVKKGVLGGSVAFIRPDIGENTVGGGESSYTTNTRPLGIFLNDALGNANENTPAVGSGKGPFLRGGAAGVKIYETQAQLTLGTFTQGDALTYGVGDRLYASVNGLLTNNWLDSLERQWIETDASGSGAAGIATPADITVMGVVLSPPDAASAEIFFEASFTP